ncbi:Metacaspase-1 [Hypsizygus marmoreus]|uniref:Metacaspase-1 n=1 Tax=Hypsizygus marmoreus TaxID=39966 RepID=A0A369J9W6_HYPMA|nr:Metacaspase-1 [Hypsizygus marmoreus]
MPTSCLPSLSAGRIGSYGSRKKALLIGVGYSDRPGFPQLRGTHQDVRRLKRLLERQYHFCDITVMTDEDHVSNDLQPTHANIIRQLANFYEGQQPGDQFLFYFAGHGMQIEAVEDVLEEDFKDESIISSDAIRILDNDLKIYLVDHLAPECRLTAVFDSCASGTVLDLPHHRCNRVCGLRNTVRRVVRQGSDVSVELGKHFLSLSDVVKTAMTPILSLSPDIMRRAGPLLCSGFCLPSTPSVENIICISACKDSETAFESEDGSNTMTSRLIDLLEKESHPTLKSLMHTISSSCADGVRKVPHPQLSSSCPLVMESSFLEL